MAVLFNTQPGIAVQIPFQSAMPLTVNLDGWGGFQGFKSIITHTGIESQGNFQFIHTLREFIYVYVFGERIGQAVISGVSFAHICPGAGGVTGPEQVMRYYDQYRISKTGRPLTLQIGTSPSGNLRGFLTSMKVDIVDPKQHLSQFTLRFHKFPPEVAR